jgi:hypothetical protein
MKYYPSKDCIYVVGSQPAVVHLTNEVDRISLIE